MSFKKDNKAQSGFSKISIGLASPEEILENSSGEVLKHESTCSEVSISTSVPSGANDRIAEERKPCGVQT